MNDFINIVIIDLCNSNAGYKLFSLLGNIFNIIKIIIPIIIIMLGMIDLSKGIINPNDKKNINLFFKRLVNGVLVYFLTSIVLFIMTLINGDINNKCLSIFLNPNDETIVLIDIDDIKDKKTCDKLGSPYVWQDNECRIDISNENISG